MPSPYTLTRGLLLSVLLHLMLLNLFTYTLRVFPSPHKPSFVFFGSILDSHELTMPGASKSRRQGPIPLTAEQIERQSASLQTQARKIHKPEFKDARQLTKELDKNQLYDFAQDITLGKEAGETASAGSEFPEPPPYKPLRLEIP